ncbi:uncharacterized protein LOC120354335 [Nilaparvata lugens]|uniref:uncharacterized protein LOC120354335 n=1 Tax=Nilaparvata lugens TaxID=108931 RepID=UPI00193E6C95|nr:uncharacterized protein LOC120354335 [Nilaparvata lugens]
MSKKDFDNLLNLIQPVIDKSDTVMREAITSQERLAPTLRFLASGDSFVSLQYLFRISKQIISYIIPEVCDALIKALKDFIKLPSSSGEWESISKEFQEKWNFPYVLGAMDGKHVQLRAPWNSGTEYYNYKHFFSIVLFALVDANYNFLYVNVGSPGRFSDGGVFKNTELYRKLENRTLNIPSPKPLQIPYRIEVPYFILGDQAFELNDYTMTPFRGTPHAGSIERIFNYRLSRARRVVENTFGVVSSKFEVLLKPIRLQPEKAKIVVLTVAYLHNYLRKQTSSNQLYMPSGMVDREESGELIPGTWRQGQISGSLIPLGHTPRRSGIASKNIQLHLAQHFSTNGSIPWQNNYS